MAKPSKIQQDRRTVVEQMRREQKKQEKRRTSMIVVVCVIVALIIIGLGAYPLIKQQIAGSGDLESLGTGAKAAGCQAVDTKDAEGNNDHRPKGEDIAYDDAPPAFGPHYPAPAPFARKFYTQDDRPQVEFLVHNLEHGYNILWYDETVADDSSELDVVKGIASKFEGSQKLKDKFIAVPWTSEDGDAFPDGTHVALTHWSMGGTNGNDKGQQGIWQYCARPSGAAVSEFMDDYPFADSPEPQAM